MSIIDELKAILSGSSENILGEVPDKAASLIGGALSPRYTYEDYLAANRAERQRLKDQAPVSSALGGALGTGAAMLSTGGASLATKFPALAGALAKTAGQIPQAAATALQVGSMTDSPALGAGVATGIPVVGKAIGSASAPLSAAGRALRKLAPFMSKGRLTPEIEKAYLANAEAIRNPVSRDEIASGAEDLAVRAKRYGGERSAEAMEAARDELGNIYPKDVVEAFDQKIASMPETIASPTGMEAKANLANARAQYLKRIGISPEIGPPKNLYGGAQLRLEPDILKRDLQGFGEAGDFDSYAAIDSILKKSPKYSAVMKEIAPSVGASVRLAKRLGSQPSGNTVANQLVDAEVKRLRGALPPSQADNLVKDINLLESNPAFGSKLGEQAKYRAMNERLMGDRTQGSSGINLWSILGGGLGGAALAGTGNYLAGDDKAAKMSMGAGAAIGATLGGLRDKKGGQVAMALLDAYKKLASSPGGMTAQKQKILEALARKYGLAATGARSMLAEPVGENKGDDGTSHGFMDADELPQGFVDADELPPGVK